MGQLPNMRKQSYSYATYLISQIMYAWLELVLYKLILHVQGFKAKLQYVNYEQQILHYQLWMDYWMGSKTEGLWLFIIIIVVFIIIIIGK